MSVVSFQADQEAVYRKVTLLLPATETVENYSRLEVWTHMWVLSWKCGLTCGSLV